MLRPFFAAAMLAPGRHLVFRQTAALNAVLVAGLAYLAAGGHLAGETLGYLLLVLGLVEGAALVGWRLTQMPKSQALEFLLASPVQPRRLFLAEALVGVCRFALAWLAGLPPLVGLVYGGVIGWAELLPLGLMPLVWGVVAGLGLTAWVYEPPGVRRAGEVVGLVGVFVYLAVGVVAAENLPVWLSHLPPAAAGPLYDGVLFLHTMNPFGVVRYWFAPDRADWLAHQRFDRLTLATAAFAVVAGVRGACRLRGHFHDRHFRPRRADRPDEVHLVGDAPLSWWAVRRVMEYSGRVNLVLAVGFCAVYAAYTVAGDRWPAWMGRLVFQLFDAWGGPAMVGCAMAVMATVPAAFQFGLWDATVPDRCRRLELLLLTELTPRDYWRASARASWVRGRGYLLAAGFLWLAVGLGGRNTWAEVLAAAAGGAALWGFAFAVGFRAFATGRQTSGLASVLVLGVPLLLVGLVRTGNGHLGGLVPPGLAFAPLAGGLNGAWAVGFVLTAGAAARLTAAGLARCDADLRRWYDANQGAKAVA